MSHDAYAVIVVTRIADVAAPPNVGHAIGFTVEGPYLSYGSACERADDFGGQENRSAFVCPMVVRQTKTKAQPRKKTAVR